ncbi:hypothetical protein CL633_04510 [bacterium]|jgi:regulatory protein YycI of two-component signal transduction system YycFG|nr:hypothetical protein [bacterium]|tara:strand:+ start:262 stop:507 length:246 start_codon:yes stop_codon:yes gene_type:complete
MTFSLGIITGILLMIAIFLIILYFKSDFKPEEKKIKTINNKPKKKLKGGIIPPPDELREAQKRIINENKKYGRATRLEELS